MASSLIIHDESLNRTTATATTSSRGLLHASATACPAQTSNEPCSTIAPYSTALNGVSQPIDNLVRDIFFWSVGLLALLILLVRLAEMFRAHLRHLFAMSATNDQQSYWAKNHVVWWPRFKKQLLYAPLFNKRHNREFRLSSAMNMGTLPSRFHAILILLYLISNVVYILILDYGRLNKYSIVAELRGRTGILAVVNMVPLVILAGRNNPLIPLLRISFDTYNLFHRWIGRTVVLESIIHTICWAYVRHEAYGWSGVWGDIKTDPFISYGTVGTVAMIFIVLGSLSPVRHAFYETFLNCHIILAIAVVIGVWVHCDLAKVWWGNYVKTFAALWIADRLARMWRLIYYNYSRKGWTTASIEAMEGDACRVTLHLPRYVDVKPGSHAYLRFSKINIWESHPFSIAWVEHEPKNSALPIAEKEYVTITSAGLEPSELKTSVSFVIHAQTGVTRRLLKLANSKIARRISIKACFEGPYAGHHSLDSYGHCVLFAGSSGITHQISYIQHLLTGFHDGTCATRRVTLVWIVRENEHLEWIRPWIDVLLRMPRRREMLTIKIFVTRPKHAELIRSASQTVCMFPGRPNVPLLLEQEVKEQVGAMCVTVCGPGGLADNVRDAVRSVQHKGAVDFIEESFTW
ncbi:ferric reductase like transmembrane component-domain-containing protein [Xylogone sp. PMI_703]|nr:ferric reductase like transmembrane component-domain-containing protein [Xylogone sp. PMI_703]